MSDDIVEELKDAADAVTACEPGYIGSLMRRASDEIMGMKMWFEKALRERDNARAEALEEAARACDARRDATTGPSGMWYGYLSACDGCAYDIRALK